jgi:hypothetical protein
MVLSKILHFVFFVTFVVQFSFLLRKQVGSAGLVTRIRLE